MSEQELQIVSKVVKSDEGVSCLNTHVVFAFYYLFYPSAGLKELHIIEEIGQGAYGKAIWRGTVVAAKEVPVSGNKRILTNEMSLYR